MAAMPVLPPFSTLKALSAALDKRRQNLQS
jgi:hypothetical protein